MQSLILQSAQGGGAYLVLIVFVIFWVLYFYNAYSKMTNQHNALIEKREMESDPFDSSGAWDCMSSWIKDVKDKKVVIKEFNNAAQYSYVNGIVPYQLKSSFSRGNKNYKHSTSAWLNSGFRITVLTDKLISENELNRIGLSLLTNSKVVRFLITLGWDTLEVVNNKGENGIQWELTRWANDRDRKGHLDYAREKN